MSAASSIPWSDQGQASFLEPCTGLLFGEQRQGSRYYSSMDWFRTTRWSLIATAAGASAEANAALAEFCRLYWPPVYAFVRSSVYRSNRCPDDALDLTQSFFASILKRKDLANAHPQRGRFRAWLLRAIRNFLHNERRYAHAQKRGGGALDLSIEEHTEEGPYPRELADELTPERLYERHWALTVIDHTMRILTHEQEMLGKGEQFERMKPFLVGNKSSYDELAREIGGRPETLRVQVHRLRCRCRQLLRSIIAQTVATPAEVDDEVLHLFRSLS